MVENNVDNFELGEIDPIFDDYLELQSVDGDNATEQPVLSIDMSPEQAATIVAEQEKIEKDSANLEQNQEENQEEGEPNLLLKLLEARGIKDGLVKIQEEDGTELDIPFDDLTAEEQFNILNDSKEEAPALAEHEQSALDFLRKNNVTLEEAIDYFTKKAVEEALADNVAESTVEGYSDEEIYAFDLLSKYKDLTEEEVLIELDKQQEHPELFKKKVDALRQQYLQAEKDQLTDKENASIKKEADEFQNITNNLIEVAKGVEDYGGIDIEIADKQDVLGFILNKDVNGITEFSKLLDKPEALFEIAWYAKKGKEAFDTLHEYYKKEITEANRKGYEKAKEELKVQQPKKDIATKLVIKQKQNNNSNSLFDKQTQYPGVESLYDDLIKPTK